jgi:hypothetical protein
MAPNTLLREGSGASKRCRPEERSGVPRQRRAGRDGMSLDPARADASYPSPPPRRRLPCTRRAPSSRRRGPRGRARGTASRAYGASCTTRQPCGSHLRLASCAAAATSRSTSSQERGEAATSSVRRRSHNAHRDVATRRRAGCVASRQCRSARAAAYSGPRVACAVATSHAQRDRERAHGRTGADGGEAPSGREMGGGGEAAVAAPPHSTTSLRWSMLTLHGAQPDPSRQAEYRWRMRSSG